MKVIGTNFMSRGGEVRGKIGDHLNSSLIQTIILTISFNTFTSRLIHYLILSL